MWVLKEHPYCVHCLAEGVQRLAVEVDHIIPVAQGGGDDYANTQSLCRAHHQAKSARERARRPPQGSR
jgi:5-methylcytosine-specific restriction protein A